MIVELKAENARLGDALVQSEISEGKGWKAVSQQENSTSDDVVLFNFFFLKKNINSDDDDDCDLCTPLTMITVVALHRLELRAHIAICVLLSSRQVGKKNYILQDLRAEIAEYQKELEKEKLRREKEERLKAKIASFIKPLRERNLELENLISKRGQREVSCQTLFTTHSNSCPLLLASDVVI